jgi:hypothetical protein
MITPTHGRAWLERDCGGEEGMARMENRGERIATVDVLSSPLSSVLYWY